MNSSNDSTLNQTNGSMLKNLDIGFRYLVFSFYLLYFILLTPLQRFLKLRYFQIHNINCIGFIQSGIYASISYDYNPLNNSIDLNQTYCYLLWNCFIFLRAYSLLLMTIYRFISLYKPMIYKRITTSYRYNYLIALIPWLISIIMFLIIKQVNIAVDAMCFYSNTKGIAFFAIYDLIGFVCPFIIIFILMVSIQIKLKKQKKISLDREMETIATNQAKRSALDSSQNSTKLDSKLFIKEKEEKLLILLIYIICIVEIISFTNYVFQSYPLERIISSNYQFLLRYILGPMDNLLLCVTPTVSIIFFVILFKLQKTK